MYVKGYPRDAGADIILDRDIVLHPGVNNIDLNVQIALPEHTCAIIAPRSSAAKKGITIATCPIDPDYCGNIHAIAVNNTTEYITYEKGMAFCQIVVLKTVDVDDITDVTFKSLGRRGNNGFGSTGNV